MSEKYKVHDQDRPYFITFAVEKWIDVFTRQQYKTSLLPHSNIANNTKDLSSMPGW
jgi:hypothetical protein